MKVLTTVHQFKKNPTKLLLRFKFKWIVVLVWSVTLITTSTWAHSNLTLTQTVQLGTNASEELQILETKVKIKEAEHQVAVSEVLPHLNLGFDMNATDYDTDGRDPLARITILQDEITVYPVAPSKYSSALDLSLRQNIFSGGRKMAQIALKNWEFKKAKLEFSEQKAQKQKKISNRYWEVIRVSIEKEYSEKIEHLTQQKLDALKSQSTGGFLLKKTLRETEVDAINRQEEKKLKAQLHKQIKAQFITENKITKNAEFNSVPSVYNEAKVLFEELQRSAVSYEPVSIKQSKIDIRIQEQVININRSPFMPEITLSVGVNYFDADDHFKKSYDNLKHGSTYFRLSVNYNLFSGFKDSANYRKATLEKQVAEKNLIKNQETSNTTVDTLIQECRTALSRLKQTEANQTALAQLLEEAQFQFQNNALAKTDLIDTQIHQIETDVSYKKAAIEMENALANLAFEIGQGDVYLRRFENQ